MVSGIIFRTRKNYHSIDAVSLGKEKSTVIVPWKGSGIGDNLARMEWVHWCVVTLGDYIGPKKSSKNHGYRPNNPLHKIDSFM